jgi:hypothetical protein
MLEDTNIYRDFSWVKIPVWEPSTCDSLQARTKHYTAEANKLLSETLTMASVSTLKVTNYNNTVMGRES